ncbi:hypothetical protein NBRC116494_26110 [Aurantivibrio plasticivorans]
MNTAEKLNSNTDIRHLLQSGKNTEALHLASSSMQFYLENLESIEVLATVVANMGFAKEAQSILGYLVEANNFRIQQQKDQDKRLGSSRKDGFSGEYRKKGTDTAWTNPFWEMRAKYIARLIPNKVKLLDLGCGNMLIERHLPDGSIYIPCDIEKRDERTVICDFDQGEYPDDCGETLVICLGVANYLSKQAELLHHICQREKPFYFSIRPKNLIQHKINEGVFPDALSFDQLRHIMSQYPMNFSYRYLLGQGDEILLMGHPKDCTKH